MTPKFTITKSMICTYDNFALNHPQASCLREDAYILGKAEFLLEALSDFGQIPTGIREQILRQNDDAQLHRWFRLARQVRSLDEFINRM